MGQTHKLKELCICRNGILLLLQALKARERSLSEADGNDWQCVVIEFSDI